jgi:hypothetical protein
MSEQKPLSQQWKELNPVMKGIAIVLVVAFCVMLVTKHSDQSQTSTQPALRVSQDYRLAAPGGDKDLLIGVSKSDAGEITSALVAKDWARIQGLLRTGQAFIVEDGIQVKFIESTLAYKRVSIQGGKMLGRTGWLPREYIK